MATFAIYVAAQGNNLNVSKAFTSLSILTLLVSPCAKIIYATPEVISAFGCIRRIQEYLVKDSRNDNRIPSLPEKRLSLETEKLDEGIAMPEIKSQNSEQAIIVHNGNFGWSTEAFVRNINLQFVHPLNLIIGPVGSGKSTLLKALLGETPISSGAVYMSSLEIGFCDQTSWIINGTIKDNIIGSSAYDEAWYITVVEACALISDLQLLPSGHLSLVGSKGITLSGGQRQRIVSYGVVYYSKCVYIAADK